jgi:hypothetical protein
MPFTVWVYSEGRNSFSVDVADAPHILERELRKLIAGSPDASELGFKASGWNVFLASAEGTKQGEKLGDTALVVPTDGEVFVWVERIAAPAAGEQCFFCFFGSLR